MIINPSLPGGHTIFCDDFRQEISGKHTFVGVYGTNLLVGEFPATLPQIFCIVTYRESVDTFGEVALRVLHEVDEEDTVLAEMVYDISEDTVPPPSFTGPFPRREGRFVFRLSPFEIEKAGILKVRAFRGEDEIRLGALRIDIAPTAIVELASEHQIDPA